MWCQLLLSVHRSSKTTAATILAQLGSSRTETAAALRQSGKEDVAARIMDFSQQGPRPVCIISATGVVSTTTLLQDSESGGVGIYEGRFEILCLSGSSLVLDGGTQTRSRGINKTSACCVGVGAVL
ncbi:unnamed protein product [Miscanthus lutarioriparius]|uniref:AT-hook motif nuclear-localized protein n=1 Tax=Miscanthus lutarioriparius TaxID=422564 RepID=A0A811Q350_9POAL|nr:unnamed protein product [Miscanthus lutarioriparius]